MRAPFLCSRNPTSGINASTNAGFPNLVLAATTAQTGLNFAFLPIAPGCDPQSFPLVPASTPAVLTDQTLGTLAYSDPLPSTWTRAETVCEEAVVPMPIPNSSATANFALVDGEAVAPSSSPLAPIVGPVESPTINGSNLFAAATLTTTTPALSWTAPATGSPYGYRVAAYVQITANGLGTYEPAGVFYTPQTPVTLPPLSAGNTYVFAITALVDGTANVQTAPFRSSLPTGFASAVSAPITISSGASRPQIHGDARVVKALSQPKLAAVNADSPRVMSEKILH
jgi:hypothetical protein